MIINTKTKEGILDQKLKTLDFAKKNKTNQSISRVSCVVFNPIILESSKHSAECGSTLGQQS